LKIRSITCFLDPGWPLERSRLQRAGVFREAALQAFQAAGYVVQTTRLATPPFPRLLQENFSQAEAQALAQELESAAAQAGFAYLSLGPAQPEFPVSFTWIPQLIAATQNVFFAGSLTDGEGRISLVAVRACAEVIQRTASIAPDGFANLRFAALANVPPGTPFFPAAYHAADPPAHRGRDFMAFALATEAADLAVQAFGQAGSLAEARQKLVGAVETHAARMEQIASDLAAQFGLGFNGIDFSSAPFPERELSVGEALERLGAPAVGAPGALAAAAILTEAIDRARFERVGFSGLFLPVLEDAVLAQRAAEGWLTVKDLLLYSAVCGTGLDTVPLPGDVSQAALQAVLLDVAVLACRLDKPLTARLMPVPGKKAGDPIGFDFAYFAPSRVMALDAPPLTGVLAGDESFSLATRRPPIRRS